MEKFNVVVASPEKMLYEGVAQEVIVPGRDGTMSVLSRHAPLLVTLKEGKVKIIKDSSEEEFEIKSGFAEVSKKKLSGAETKNRFVNIFVRQP